MASPPSLKVVVMLPHNSANIGMAVPMRAAPMDPKKMRILSVLSANLKSYRKETIFYYFSLVDIFLLSSL